MIKLLLVGDEPSKRNTSSFVPFVGASCFTRLVYWIQVLKPDYYIVSNSDTHTQLYNIQELSAAGFKVVALGNKASKRLECNNIEHFKLPHPSGSNRMINSNETIKNELEKCWTWLRNPGKMFFKEDIALDEALKQTGGI